MEANCDFKSEIVISGISGRFPKAANLDEFWQNLIDGTDMIGEASMRYNVDDVDVPKRLGVLSDLDKFDADFFTLHAKQASSLDPRIRMLLEVTYEAIVDAGINPITMDGRKTGVFLAASDGGAMGILSRSSTLEKMNKYALLGNVGSMLANRLSYTFNLQGPSYVVDTACSSSFVALQQALQAIRAGTCDSAIVATAQTHHERTPSICFHALKMTSPDGKCKSFDASADGYVRSEAVVAIYICKRPVAKRSYGTLVHATTNCDGYKEQGITFPSNTRQECVMRQLYTDTGVSPLEVGYIEAHGTGTKVGDPQEIAAITSVFCDGREGPLLVGSIKSNMGHSEPASGLCGIAKVVLAHSNGVIPANLHYQTPNPDIPSLLDGTIKVVDKNQPFSARYVAFNSMGFGGTNVHVLIKFDTKETIKSWSPPVPVILVASGRTHEAVELFLQKTLERRENQSFVRLTHEVAKTDTPRHGFRGYVVVDSDKTEIQVEGRDKGREMWFIITGLGSQWPGMSRDLIKFEVFKTSIGKSAQVLLNNNFDIIKLLECGDPTQFEDFKNSVVSITTIQVALIDLLRSIGIKPDGIVGHSTGEVASGYADGCLTQEQAVLTSFARVRAVLESNLKPGMVASVGLTWDDAKNRCPQGVWPVIHNAEENVTIAGSPDDITKFTKELESEGVFVKLVRSASFGFHSPLVEESGKLAKNLLEKIIPDPKPRSKKWLSSSVPESRWDTDLAKYCSADYYVNNGINPVYFYPTLKHVPENVVALEIGPHCFFQSILKKSLPKNALTFGLIHVKSPDNCVYFLNSIGKCYLAGVNFDVSALYEPIKFPVSAATPNLSSIIRWDHSESFSLPNHAMELSNQKGVKFTFDLNNEQDSFLQGHMIDHKIVFPATGYIWITWKCFAQMTGYRFENLPVVFENVRFERMTILNKTRNTNLVVNIFEASGKFEISESGNLVCSGNIRNVDNTVEHEMLDYKFGPVFDTSGSFVTKEDFYKEMHLRGYGHSGLFQGIEQAHMEGKWAIVKWQGEWVSFIDTMLQAFLLRNDDRELYVPLRMQKLTIDPIELMEHLQANESLMTVKSWEDQNTGTCAGMEFRGLAFAKFNQKSRQLPQATIEQKFLSYLNNSQALSETGALESSIEIAFDNLFDPKLICAEVLQSPANMIAHRIVNESILRFPTSEFYLLNTSNDAVDEDNIAIAMSKVVTIDDLQTMQPSILFVDDEVLLRKFLNSVNPDGFILFKGSEGKVFTDFEVSVVSEKPFLHEGRDTYSYYLLKKLRTLSKNSKVINVDPEGYRWVETAKEALKSLAEIERIYFVSECPRSGIAGFFKCLSREYTSEKLRCFHAIEALEMDFNNPNEILEDQINKDLVMNIFKINLWGSFHNLSISKEEFWKKRLSSLAYANALTLGELSSLSWIESPLKNVNRELAKVYFSALNFKDVMLASGKLSQNALTKITAKTECVLGLEFSGMYKNKRVCGMGNADCLATHVDAEKQILLDIPDDWTFEEAATVPCVYTTVYIALIIRGRMEPGESILIHAGSGGVGQAAIQIALSMNCRVFTTVSSREKREFLKARFPALTDDCFTNSREEREFESYINAHTNGKGVDLVLNSLAQDKLFASIRCLAVSGRFLEIGKFDVFNDTKIGMTILAKGVSVFGILADQVLETAGPKELAQLKSFFTTGMASGLIKPLSYHVFTHNQLEDAFRFMAQGKHIGKVLIQVKDSENVSAVVSAQPRTYFDNRKSYIIVGGLGGMGFELANWLVKRGAKNLILSSRSGKTSSYHDYHIGLWKRNGVKLLLDNSDASVHNGAERLLQTATTLGPIGGIFNVAVVLKDAVFENQTATDFEEVTKCKADATVNLDALSRQLAPELEYFVVFSSIIAARGNPGQTNYGFANSVMERICEERKSQGLPALAIQWGAVGDVGVFHRTMKDKNVFGLAPQSLKSCLETLDLYLQQDKPIVSSFIPFYRKQTTAADSSESLVTMAANILGIKDVKKIDLKVPLVELGLDSLMAAELGQVLLARWNVQLSQKDFASLNFEKLAEIDSNGNGTDGTVTKQNDVSMVSARKMLTLKPAPQNAMSQMQSLKCVKDNLFIVHPIEGSVESLEELVSQLNLTVYGLECTNDAPLASVEQLAGFYLSKIKEIQTKGPYKLCGYSFGANVAFEMALQLEAQNESVSVLIMLDGSPRWKNLQHENEIQDMDIINWLAVIFLSQYMPEIGLNIHTDLKECQTVELKVEYTANVLHQTHPDLSAGEIKHIFNQFLARGKIGLDYHPNEKVQAKTILLKSAETKFGKEVAYDYNLAEICENEVEVLEIQGDHYCFFEKPTELGLAGILNNILA